MEKARQHPALGPATIALAVALCTGAPSLAGDAARVTLASGLEARLLDTRLEEGDGEGAQTLRLRYVAEGLVRESDHSDDMQELCEGHALPSMAGMDPVPAHVVITLADREIPFGEAAPEAVQFFESYRIEDGACVWELF